MNAKRIEELKCILGKTLHLASLDGRDEEVSDIVDLLSVLDEWAEVWRLKMDNARLELELIMEKQNYKWAEDRRKKAEALDKS